jgi:hypothetical protein
MSEITTAVEPRQFTMSASVLGGAVAIAGGAFFGTLCANLSVWLLMARGIPAEQAYTVLASSGFTALTSLSVLLAFLSGIWGGYVSAKYGGMRVILQAFVASLFPILFALVMYLGPSSQSGPPWYVAYTFIGPVVASLIGAAFRGTRI